MRKTWHNYPYVNQNAALSVVDIFPSPWNAHNWKKREFQIYDFEFIYFSKFQMNLKWWWSFIISVILMCLRWGIGLWNGRVDLLI